jgi:hypothetical protein
MSDNQNNVIGHKGNSIKRRIDWIELRNLRESKRVFGDNPEYLVELQEGYLGALKEYVDDT